MAQPSSHPIPRGRKRLQKKRPIQQSKTSMYSCKDATDLVRLQTCLNLLSGVHELENNVKIQSRLPMYSQEDEMHFQASVENFLNETVKIDTPGKVEEIEMQRWRNAKTPVFAIGQLEMRSSPYLNTATAEGFASIYQALLPSPPTTPFSSTMKSRLKQGRIRKMKSEHSLRNHFDSPSRSPAWTETETLCGYDFERNEDNRFSDLTYPAKHPGLELCSGLLTCELAGVFFQQHPKEQQNRISRLQIQLMIEGYEDTFQKLQREPGLLMMMGLVEEDLITTERILNHWLEVLYYLYDLADGLTPANI